MNQFREAQPKLLARYQLLNRVNPTTLFNHPSMLEDFLENIRTRVWLPDIPQAIRHSEVSHRESEREMELNYSSVLCV